MRFKSGLDYFRPQSRPERIVFKRQTDPGSTKMYFEQIRPGISV